MIGLGHTNVNQKKRQGAPFPANAANNGLSVDPVSGKIVLGNDLTFSAGIAQLLSSREIFVNNFGVFLTGQVAGDTYSFFTSAGQFGMIGAVKTNGAQFTVDSTNAILVLSATEVGSNPPQLSLASPAGNGVVLQGAVGAKRLDVIDNVGTFFQVSRAGGIKITGDTTLIHTGTALANGSAANAGTLNNAPAAGNPTKWVPIDDNGTTRFIPAW